MKKLQKTISLCLGDHDCIQELLNSKLYVQNPIYEILFSLHQVINHWIHKILAFEAIELTNLVMDVNYIFELSRIFILAFIEGKIPPELNHFPYND
jgi:hypothetical protein